MIFKQLFDNNSSTYTYLIASKKGREALIIDPVIENVDNYIQLLNELDLKLVKVIDTHIHADHVTGASKLKDKTKCITIMGDHTPADSVEIKVKDGELIKLDQLELRAIYTPGHTSDSFSFLMNNSEISDIEIHLSQIKVTKMSYEEADKSLYENIWLSKLNEIAKEHKKYRESRGAIRLDLPKTDIKVKDQRVLVFPQIKSESREMVSEMMVLAGRSIAQYSIENNISMPYLSQAPGKFSDEIIENIHNLSLSMAFEAAKGFSRSKLSAEPSMHAGLGLEAYIRVTSPMRRYLDLLAQQQLVKCISNLELLKESDVKDRIKVNNASMSKINKASRQSIEHFRCLYFKQNRSWEGEGVVIEISGNKTLLMIPEFAMITQVKVKTEPNLEDKINLKVSSIDLFERLVDFKPL